MLSAVLADGEMVNYAYGSWAFATSPAHTETHDALMARTLENLTHLAAQLDRAGVTATAGVLIGHPAEVICADAANFKAEIIIIGSRGHGALANALLGSVSAAVVDHAPCPVLVARTSAIHRIMLGFDGSPAAMAACNLVSSPLFDGADLMAAVVADTRWPWWSGVPETAGIPSLPAQEAMSEAAIDHARAAAAQVRDALAARDCACESVLLEGDPASALIGEATRQGVDLIAMGSRGYTGLRRLALGSVARNVLLHAPCSVLITHG